VRQRFSQAIRIIAFNFTGHLLFATIIGRYAASVVTKIRAFRSGLAFSILSPSRLPAALCGLTVLLFQAGATLAQNATPPAKDAISGRQLELQSVQDTLEASTDQRKKIEAEIETIRHDRVKLSKALTETSQKVAAAETRSSAIEKRLETLTGSEDAIRRSLNGRRAVIAEILASLQRMGRKPPPALLASPEDILRAIRTSMLLGAVLPEMRAETEALTADLNELVSLRKAIAADKEALAKEIVGLNGDRLRLAALVDARQGALNLAEQALSAERERAKELAKQATSLKDLIGRMETEIGAASKASAAAQKADDERKKAAEADAQNVKTRLAAGPFKDPARLAPAVSFTDAKGLLPMPASGTILKAYGAADGFGGTEKGLSLATRTNALVASPSDGWIVYSGPYRTYGQLLIINAGGGYYIVLAGMERINVEVGQFVLAGEPVASMGDASAKTAAAIAIGAAQPILYVEFRKDGSAIDPGPWWAKTELQKVRG